jgi:hypothetical protein
MAGEAAASVRYPVGTKNGPRALASPWIFSNCGRLVRRRMAGRHPPNRARPLDLNVGLAQLPRTMASSAPPLVTSETGAIPSDAKR